MAYRVLAPQALEDQLIEDLGHEPQFLVDDHRLPIRDGHPGGLLATMLEGVESVVSEPGDVLVRRIDPNDAASVPSLSHLRSS